jgi:hypothetical protein
MVAACTYLVLRIFLLSLLLTSLLLLGIEVIQLSIRFAVLLGRGVFVVTYFELLLRVDLLIITTAVLLRINITHF